MSIPGLRRATRAEPAAAPEDRPLPVDPGPDLDTSAPGPVVPRQRQRRDAFDLYVEVYALRLDLDDPPTE